MGIPRPKGIEAVAAGPARAAGMKDAERVRQAKDGDVIEFTGAPLTNHELDRAVAEAVGDPYPRAHDWEYTGMCDYDSQFFRCKRCGDLEADDGTPGYNPKTPCLIHYSIDLNVAFAAAEKVGLFDHGGSELLRSEITNEWYIRNRTLPSYTRYSTPALAICAAILRLQK